MHQMALGCQVGGKQLATAARNLIGALLLSVFWGL